MDWNTVLQMARGLPRTAFNAVAPETIPSQMWVPEGARLPVLQRPEMRLKTAAEILAAARAAVEGRRREQEQQGMVSYAPANPAILDDALRTRLGQTSVPAPALYTASDTRNMPVSVQQRGGDSGGATTTYGSGERVVTGRYGSGSATKPAQKPPMTITENGKTIPAAKWFQEAANRQGQRIVVGGDYEKGDIFEPRKKKES